MAKAVFTTKVSPAYDDLPERHYHFPLTYLRQVEAAIGDWIVYYEPRRSSDDRSSSGGRQAYFATARVDAIVPDPARDKHYYARVSQYLEFDRAVPFIEGGLYYESTLRKSDGTTNKGAFGRAVRRLEETEYHRILTAGFAPVLEEQSLPLAKDQVAAAGFGELFETSRISYEPETQQRSIIEQLVSRPFRDRAFAIAVKSAYDNTCAITGLRLINGGGRSEVQAAHIRPVADEGPDSVRNGIALSGTVHWMFDRGLISLDEDYSLLLARERLPDTIYRLLPEHGRILLPGRAELRPHPQFLKWHRERIFKG